MSQPVEKKFKSKTEKCFQLMLTHPKKTVIIHGLKTNYK